MSEAAHLLAIGAELGEGPVWVGDALWFVDIKRHAIYRHTPAMGQTDRWAAPAMVGWVLPSAQGDMIAGLQSGPHRFDPATGTFTLIAPIDAQHPANRLNDAAIDRHGRLFFGTMDNDEAAATGSVFMLDRGVVSPTHVEPCVITNGPALSPGGDALYHVDTLARTLVRYPIAADGALGGGEAFLRFEGDEGYPDGACCDAAGGVWIGFYGGWHARRYGPDGVLTDEVRMPVSNVTKVALGGADGRTAFATTARQGLDAAALAGQPMAGDVFTFPVAIPGVTITHCNS